MALFYYQALSKSGKRVSGTIDASTLEAAREHVAKQGLYPISITMTSQETKLGWRRFLRIFTGRVSSKDKILFTKQLAVLLRSGVPLLQALELMIEQTSGQLKAIVITLRDSIKEGQSLAAGLAKYPRVFDKIYVQLVRAGEASGKLEVILERLTDYLERRQAIVKRIRGAMTYPIIQLVIITLVVIALLTFVLPNLTQTFVSQGIELPFTTAFLIGLSNVLIRYWWIILLVLIVLIIAFRWWKSTPRGARTIDKIKLKIPIVKFFARMGAIVQFSRTLGMLIESGVNLTEALDIVVNIIDNRILADALHAARDKIIKQGRIAEFLEQTKIFPPIAIYLIRTGEQTGQLDAMLLTVAKNYEDDIAEYADRLSSLLEPIMLVIMAIIVGFIVLSVMQPILNQMTLFKF